MSQPNYTKNSPTQNFSASNFILKKLRRLKQLLVQNKSPFTHTQKLFSTFK